MSKRRIYISGKVSGKSEACMHNDFGIAERRLKKKFPDAEIINPVDMTTGIAKNCPTFTHDEYMDLCLTALSTCTTIYLLIDWTQSEGARQEVSEAIELGMEILTEGGYEWAMVVS